MKDKYELKFSFVIILSLFLHLIVIVSIVMPDVKHLAKATEKRDKQLFGRRQIIVNINEDNKRYISKKTLISDRTSSARGHVTKEKGDSWLFKTFDFQKRHGVSGRGTSSGRRVNVKGEKIMLNDESEVVAILQQKGEEGNTGMSGRVFRNTVPQRINITRKNALYYSADGMFSFNTIKMLDPEVMRYAKRMIQKIAYNWHPPIMSRASLGGYAPGYTKIMAIPAQDVVTYFILNRSGDILQVKLVESYGNTPLDRSCMDAIRFSKSFGKVPDKIKGNNIYIPFIFIYR